MKKIIFAVLVFVSLFYCQQTFAKELLPPGCVKVNDSLYADATEISNIDYLEFVTWNLNNKGADSEEYRFSLPDTTVWSSKYLKPFTELYFRHPAYSKYPVVGVSYEQALAYCEWRSDRVNELIYVKNNKISYDEVKKMKDIPEVFHYRLPTEQEWEQIAAMPYSEKINKKLTSEKYSGLNRYNLTTGTGEILDPAGNDNADITAPVYSYWPNALGIYNIIGNVAEMTAEKGLAKGGSWTNRVDEVQVEKDFNYEKPDNWLGFRCVCEKVSV